MNCAYSISITRKNCRLHFSNQAEVLISYKKNLIETGEIEFNLTRKTSK